MSRPEAKDIMTEGVIAIGREATIKDASRKMKENNIRSLVVTEEEEAVGILVGKDILYAVTASGRDPASVKVKDVMTEDVITASEYDDVSDIATAMLENDISRLPVLRGDEVVGIVTETNILRAWPGYLDLLEEQASSGRTDI
ncbi:MAG: CBS domain-containing protein [Candidatus Nanohaloarchaea archaeon]|nr:CBS domain-containing protein [Candidatus Nanohaloarchaea archaeon]